MSTTRPRHQFISSSGPPPYRAYGWGRLKPAHTHRKYQPQQQKGERRAPVRLLGHAALLSSPAS